jgi:drug/metabolite transporter (DMT)-like permease
MNVPLSLLYISILGLAPLFYKLFLANYNTITIVFLGSLISFLLMTIVYAFNTRTIQKDLTTFPLAKFAFLVVCTSVIGAFVYMQLLKSNPAYEIACLTAIAPIVTALASYFIFQQNISTLGCIGILLTVFGVFVFACESGKRI